MFCNVPTDDLKPALFERLEQVIAAVTQQKDKEQHHVERGLLHAHCSRRQQHFADHRQEERFDMLEAKHKAAPSRRSPRQSAARSSPSASSRPRTQALLFAQAPDHGAVSILGQLGKTAGERAACVKREWRSVVEKAKASGMY